MTDATDPEGTNQKTETMTELSNKEVEGVKYRVENDDGKNNGYSGTERGAARMAESAAEIDPDSGPYHVRRVPEDEVHFDAAHSVGEVVYSTD